MLLTNTMVARGSVIELQQTSMEACHPLDCSSMRVKSLLRTTWKLRVTSACTLCSIDEPFNPKRCVHDMTVTHNQFAETADQGALLPLQSFDLIGMREQEMFVLQGPTNVANIQLCAAAIKR